MMPAREFDWGYELGMYAGTAAGVLVAMLVVAGLILLINLLGRRRPASPGRNLGLSAGATRESRHHQGETT